VAVARSLPTTNAHLLQKHMVQASEKATAAVQILKGNAVEPTALSEPATTTTASGNVAAVQSLLALPSAVRKGRPPGSTNRPVQATVSRSSTQDQPGQPKGPGHEQFPLTTWSLTVSRVSKDPKNNDVPPEFLANIKVFFDDYCVRGIHNLRYISNVITVLNHINF
jgi:hypothetical protein